MKLNKVIPILIVVLFVAATLVPTPVAAQTDLLAMIYANQIPGVTYYAEDRAVVIIANELTDKYPINQIEAALQNDGWGEPVSKNASGSDWIAPNDWKGPHGGADAGGGESSNVTSTNSSAALIIPTLLALFGIGMWGLSGIRILRGAQA